jgi:hypothetical protein
MDTRPVSAASASALSAPGWILACVGAAGQLTFGRIGCDVSLGPRAAWSSLPNLGLAGKDGRALAVRGSHEGRRQTWAAAAHAHRLRRRARHLADQGVSLAPGCRWLAENHEKEQVLTSPRRCVLSKLPAWCPTHRLTGSGDHSPWSLCCVGPVSSSAGEPIRFGGGVGCGRIAAAVHEAHGPLGADSGLTSNNSGGRDRV